MCQPGSGLGHEVVGNPSREPEQHLVARGRGIRPELVLLGHASLIGHSDSIPHRAGSP
jgi:hypothetical protein